MGGDEGRDGDGDEDMVLATLPGGARVVSTLLTHLTPPRHVYRVTGRGGGVLREFLTLVELLEFVAGHLERPAPDLEA